jgi:retron-type reverse transcriptase
VNWILDADLRGFFDTLNHEWLVQFLEHRVTDSRILRLIQKWLKAGVSEDGAWSESKFGTPPVAEIWEQLYHHCLPMFTYIMSSTCG